MLSRLPLSLRAAAMAALISCNAHAALRDRYTLPDGGVRRPFVIATDEVQGRDAQKRTRSIALKGAGNAEAVRKAAAQAVAPGEEPRLVLYEEGKPRDKYTRRVVTRRVAVKIKPGVDAAAVAQKHGLAHVEAIGFAPGWHLFEAKESGAALEALDALALEPGVESAEPQLAKLKKKRLIPNDTLFGNQWHLRNTGQSGILAGVDANVVSVWDTYKGAGIRIGIVDDGMQITHPDISPNADTVNDHDWNDGTPNDPSPLASNEDFHGTACAGVAGGRGNNGIGISGAAPEATLVGMRLIADITTDAEDAEAMNWKSDIIQVKSNSWGPYTSYDGPGALAAAALANSALNGRGGLGTIFLWAGGNDGDSGDNANYDGYANSIYAICVGAIDSAGQQSYYSEPGANVLISAPSSGGTLDITTTDLTGVDGYNDGVSGLGTDAAYTNDFGGTSSATPLVAGVTALILQRNPNLGWRDMQEILIRSATKIDPTDPDWITNGAGFHFNHKFGAGMVNAQAAVNLAGTWANLGTHQNVSSAQTGLSVTIPDNNATGITRTFSIASNLRVEHVTLTLNVNHAYRGDLNITLTSPSGTVSRLAEKNRDDGINISNWAFSTVRSWGEPAKGTWTLRISDSAVGDAGTLTSATLRIYGSSGNTPPVVTAASVTPAGNVFSDQTLTVGGVTATDAEGDAITLGYQWQESADGADFTDIAGATFVSLALGNAQSGKYVRCGVIPSGPSNPGGLFHTNAVIVNRRPVELGRHGQAYSYDSDLLATGSGPSAARPFLINELSQGSGAAREWLELLTLQTADLRGFVLKDRNVTYTTFASVPVWSEVPAGTLIVIYNSGAKDTNLPADDLDYSDGKMILPANKAGFFNFSTWSGLSDATAQNFRMFDSRNVLVDGVSIANDTATTPKLGPVGATKAAHFTGGNNTDAELVANWAIINANAATPGAGNGGANSAFVATLRAGPQFQLAASSDIVPGVTIDPVTGVLSGTPNVPGGGFFQIVIERTGSPGTQTYPLLIADSNGLFTLPAGETWTMDQSVNLTGNLTLLGTLNTAGHTLTVNGTLAVQPGATITNPTGTIAYLDRSGATVPGTTNLISNPTNDLLDGDGDGVANLLEFKLGMNPSVHNSSGLPTVTRTSGRLTMTYSTPVGAAGVSATVEVSSNLTTWQSGAGFTEVLSDTTNGGIRTVVVRDLSAATPRYIRLKASR